MFTSMCAARHLISGKSSENLLETDLHISRYRVLTFLLHWIFLLGPSRLAVPFIRTSSSAVST